MRAPFRFALVMSVLVVAACGGDDERIPPVIDAALRRLAEREHKSLNTVALEALTRGLELAAAPAKFDDLDHLVGSWQDDSEFERVMADFGRVDEEAWK